MTHCGKQFGKYQQPQKINAIEMTVPHIHPNNMIMDARKHRVAKTSILDLLVISKH